MAEGFQRGETLSFPIFIRDGNGDQIDTTGGAISVLVKARGVLEFTLTEGSGITVLDETPATGEPHATGVLTAAQTAELPLGRIPKVQAKFVDTTGQVFLQPEQFLDDVAAASSLDVDLGGSQGPAGPALGADARVQALGSVSGAVEIDLGDGGVITATIAGATTFAFTGAAEAGLNTTFALVLTDPGAFAITWPEEVDWGDDGEPTFPATGRARLAFATEDEGASWDGALAFIKTGA